MIKYNDEINFIKLPHGPTLWNFIWYKFIINIITSILQFDNNKMIYCKTDHIHSRMDLAYCRESLLTTVWICYQQTIHKDNNNKMLMSLKPSYLCALQCQPSHINSSQRSFYLFKIPFLFLFYFLKKINYLLDIYCSLNSFWSSAITFHMLWIMLNTMIYYINNIHMLQFSSIWS